VSFRFFPCVGQEHQYYLPYFGVYRPARMRLDVPDGEWYRAEIVDTSEMTTTPLPEPIMRRNWPELPDKPYQAVILYRIDQT
jgi:hypothetical protein